MINTPSPAPAQIPALIFHDDQIGGLPIAAVSLLERLIVTLHRAGAGSIMVVAKTQPEKFRRLAALNIPVQFVEDAPPRSSTMLVASSRVLVQTSDVRTLLEQGGRLMTSNGCLLPIGLLPAGDEPWETALNRLPVQTAGRGAGLVADASQKPEAERILWSSIQSSADGLVDRFFNRPCGRLLSKLLVHTPVSPNAVSLTSVSIGLIAAWFFAMGDRQAIIAAAILFQISAIVDCVDGDLARVLFKESALGKWIDLGGDQVVHIAVFVGIGIGLVRSGESPIANWLAISAVLGALFSFAVVLRGMRQSAGDRSRFLQKLIDSATNRDFSALVLLLACVNQLDWFLWMTAIGSHVFWITAFALQLGPAMKEKAAQ